MKDRRATLIARCFKAYQATEALEYWSGLGRRCFVTFAIRQGRKNWLVWMFTQERNES